MRWSEKGNWCEYIQNVPPHTEYSENVPPTHTDLSVNGNRTGHGNNVGLAPILLSLLLQGLARSSSSAQKQPAFSFFAANPPRSTKSTKTTAGHQIILGHSRFCSFSIFCDMIGLGGSDTFAADTMKCPQKQIQAMDLLQIGTLNESQICVQMKQKYLSRVPSLFLATS